MPYIYDGILRCSIFLYGSEADAKAGANWGGSGVVIGVPSHADPRFRHLYAVTVDHVASGCPVVRMVDVAAKRPAHVALGGEAGAGISRDPGSRVGERLTAAYDCQDVKGRR